jgi:NodT family efflux transporter outer membrane factor (OMF) lipoprotein
MARRLVLIAAAALSACAPNLGPAPRVKPPAAYATAQSFRAPPAAWPDEGWWRRYSDPQLDALVDEALANAPSLVEAQARVRRARALEEEAGAALAPNLSANAQASEVRQSYNMGFPPQFIPKGFNDQGRATLDLNWDVDLFGRNRANLKAAASDAEAARMDADEARLLLTTNVVSAYADLAALFAQREAQAMTLQERRSTAELVSQRAREGVTNEGEASQAEALAVAAEQQLVSFDEQIAIARNRVAALVGAGPDRGLRISRPSASIALDYRLPENLAVDLVGRRPDLQAARFRAEAAASRVGAAKAGFYPNINLAAYIGRQALGLDLFRLPTSTIGEGALALSLPIFTAGKLEGEYRGARADYDVAVAAYDETLVQALQQVADAAASARELNNQLTLARGALAKAEDAYRIARLRYQAGLNDYLWVLTAEDALIIQRRSVMELEARVLSVDAALVRALGGGFRLATAPEGTR